MDARELVHRRRRRYQRFFRRAFMVGAGLALILFGVPLLYPAPVAPYAPVPSNATTARLIPYELVDSQVLLVSILLAFVLWSLAGWITATVLLWLESFRDSHSARPRFHTR